MRDIFKLLVLSIVLFSCGSSNEKSAEFIVKEAIVYAGGDNYAQAKVNFNFRQKSYESSRVGGMYQYKRIFTDSMGTYEDVLTNEGFTRYLNGTEQNIPDSMAVKYQNSVNSVHYFSQLPFGLNAPAVNKERLENTSIKGKEYYKIKVTFSEKGGGEDFEDVFLYWFDTLDYSMDYLAYSYLTDGGGMRFRSAYNQRRVKNINFADYKNFKPLEENATLEQLDVAFEKGALEEVSVIETTDVKVQLLSEDL